MLRGLLLLVSLSCGCTHLSDRERGYEAGRKMVRDVRDMNGPMGEMIVRIAEFSPNPPDPKKSPEWNGEFRAGVHDELEHPANGF
jgi:hypothetical protein